MLYILTENFTIVVCWVSAHALITYKFAWVLNQDTLIRDSIASTSYTDTLKFDMCWALNFPTHVIIVYTTLRYIAIVSYLDDHFSFTLSLYFLDGLECIIIEYITVVHESCTWKVRCTEPYINTRVYFRISLKRGQAHCGKFQIQGGQQYIKYRKANCQGGHPLAPWIKPWTLKSLGKLHAHVYVHTCTHLIICLGSIMFRLCRLLNLSMARLPSGYKKNIISFTSTKPTSANADNLYNHDWDGNGSL